MRIAPQSSLAEFWRTVQPSFRDALRTVNRIPARLQLPRASRGLRGGDPPLLSPFSTLNLRLSTSSGPLLSAVSCELSASVSPLECAVPRFPPLTPLECAVTKTASAKFFRMRSYKNRWGGGSSNGGVDRLVGAQLYPERSRRSRCTLLLCALSELCVKKAPC